jgi:hypothetical protein
VVMCTLWQVRQSRRPTSLPVSSGKRSAPDLEELVYFCRFFMTEAQHRNCLKRKYLA